MYSFWLMHSLFRCIIYLIVYLTWMVSGFRMKEDAWGRNRTVVQHNMHNNLRNDILLLFLWVIWCFGVFVGYTLCTHDKFIMSFVIVLVGWDIFIFTRLCPCVLMAWDCIFFRFYGNWRLARIGSHYYYPKNILVLLLFFSYYMGS